MKLIAVGARLFRRILPWGVLGRVVLASTLGEMVNADLGKETFAEVRNPHFAFSGPVGDRIRANVDSWLLCAPQANPGMLEMFRVRDRQPAPQRVPWAGEFVGKYLISAVQSLRLTDDPRLREQVAAVVSEFIATQADDGYLGPFPKAERLLKHWDLWGHYHALLALVLWHEASGDPAALAAARKAADLACATYLDTGRRVYDAGDPEMNMTILTGLARLYRITGEPRYLRLVREVEKDWERAGDYLRSGLDGREYFQSPRPRWESLHDLQGLIELWKITGDEKYRAAFEHHWRSIRRWDRRNSGAFSSGEQATGNPYAPTAIETCCTVAWMAITVDYLRLTGDPLAADELELSTLNGGLGTQHPSGRWWTYSTPMDGAREASAHTIVFQAHAGTPELNCCSVNGPRVLGMLGEWAMLSSADGLILNWLGAGRFTTQLADGTEIAVISSTDAWREGHTEIQLAGLRGRELTLRLRIPAWAVTPQLTLNGASLKDVVAGTYASVRRVWQGDERLALSFQMPLRAVAGAREAEGKVAMYRGPVLLTYDQAENPFDEGALPAIDLTRLERANRVEDPDKRAGTSAHLRPWLVVEVPTTNGTPLRLVDFASAGASGTRYRSWLPAGTPLPPPAMTRIPADGAHVPPGNAYFQWRGSRDGGLTYRVEFAPDAAFRHGAGWSTNVSSNHLSLPTTALGSLGEAKGTPVFWRVVSKLKTAETIPDVPPAWFRVDPEASPQVIPAETQRGPRGEVILHSLRAGESPRYGKAAPGNVIAGDAEGTEVNGRDQLLRYPVGTWPEEDFSIRVKVLIREVPSDRIGQIFSAWAGAMDDPLRLVVDGGKLFARIEAGTTFSTPGVVVATDRWYAIVAVKRGSTLTLYLDDRSVGSCTVPEFSNTQAFDFALGGNPHFGGNEFLPAKFADLEFVARAVEPDGGPPRNVR